MSVEVGVVIEFFYSFVNMFFCFVVNGWFVLNNMGYGWRWNISSFGYVFNCNGYKNFLFMVIWIMEMCFIKDSD